MAWIKLKGKSGVSGLHVTSERQTNCKLSAHSLWEFVCWHNWFSKPRQFWTHYFHAYVMLQFSWGISAPISVSSYIHVTPFPIGFCYIRVKPFLYKYPYCSLLQSHFIPPAYEDGTDRVFRNVGIYNSDAGELLKRKHNIFIQILEQYLILVLKQTGGTNLSNLFLE